MICRRTWRRLLGAAGRALRKAQGVALRRGRSGIGRIPPRRLEAEGGKPGYRIRELSVGLFAGKGGEAALYKGFDTASVRAFIADGRKEDNDCTRQWEILHW